MILLRNEIELQASGCKGEGLRLHPKAARCSFKEIFSERENMNQNFQINSFSNLFNTTIYQMIKKLFGD